MIRLRWIFLPQEQKRSASFPEADPSAPSAPQYSPHSRNQGNGDSRSSSQCREPVRKRRDYNCVLSCTSSPYTSSLSKVFMRADISMGFATCASIPAFIASCISSAKALAVIAMIGIWRPVFCSRFRMARAAS